MKKVNISGNFFYCKFCISSYNQLGPIDKGNGVFSHCFLSDLANTGRECLVTISGGLGSGLSTRIKWLFAGWSEKE